MSVRYDNEWRDAATQYTNAKLAFDEIKKELEVAKDALLQLTDEDASGFGVEVKFTERRGSIDYGKVIKAHLPDVDLEPYRKKSSSVVNVSIAKEE